MKDKLNAMDFVFLAIFGLGSVVVFGVELIFPAPLPSQRETVLYNVLEFGLSLGLGWVLQRIDAKKQFQESLKKFALSAYRRITDIQKSVNRLKGEITQMRSAYSRVKVHELDILRMVAEEMDNTVNSSISDWVDIIGQELDKKERIQELKREQKILFSRQNAIESEKLHEIKDEIIRLRSELPGIMSIETQNMNFSKERNSYIVVEHFFSSIEAYSGINLKIMTNEAQSGEFLEKNQPYFLKFEQSFSSAVASVVNQNNEPVGQIINPFKFDDIEDSDFVNTLVRMVVESLLFSEKNLNNESMPRTFSSSVEVQYIGVSQVYPNEFFIKVPVNPLIAFRG